MHSRAAIKTAIVAALMGTTNAGVKIYPARYLSLPESLLPAICVFTPLETIADSDSLNYLRTCTVKIECIAEGFDSESESILDVLSAQAERALAIDITLGGVVKSLKLKKVDTGEDPGADRDILATVMTYEAEYRSASYYNGTFDDLKTVTADYNRGKASDTIDLT
jgi:hypothetical protein